MIHFVGFNWSAEKWYHILDQVYDLQKREKMITDGEK